MSAQHDNYADGIRARQRPAEPAVIEDRFAETEVSAAPNGAVDGFAHDPKSGLHEDEIMQGTTRELGAVVESKELADAGARTLEKTLAISSGTEAQDQVWLQPEAQLRSESDCPPDEGTSWKPPAVESLASQTTNALPTTDTSVNNALDAVEEFEVDSSKKRADSRLQRAGEVEERQHVETFPTTVQATEQQTSASASPRLHTSEKPIPPTPDSAQPSISNELDLVVRFAKCSKSEAQELLNQAGGDPVTAVMIANQAKSSTRAVAPQPTLQEQPMTLLHEALAEFAKKPLRLRKRGDVAIIIDAEDLSRTILLQSIDLAEISAFFEAEDNEADNIQGVRYLYVLKPLASSRCMPVLARHNIHTMRTDVAKAELEQKVEKRKLRSSNRAPVKTESDGSHTPDAGEETDWMTAYEIFFRMLAHFPPPYGISPTKITHALPKIEAISTIAAHYDVSPDSAVHSAFSTLFSGFINNRVLWEAVAQDAARWLLIGINLKSSLLYSEAFVHIVGAYPDWPWSRQPQDLPAEVLCTIRTQAKILHYRRVEVDRQLTFLTLSGKTSVTRNVINIYRDWLLDHLGHLSNDNHEQTLQTDDCDHSSPEAECLTLAGLYRVIGRGGDAYLPVEILPANAHSGLKQIKKRASEIVAPLSRSSLQYERKDYMKYLTCIEVEDADVPWQRCVKVEEDDMDCL